MTDSSKPAPSASSFEVAVPSWGIFSKMPLFVRMLSAAVRWTWWRLSCCSQTVYTGLQEVYLIPLPHDGAEAVFSMVPQVIGLLCEAHSSDGVAIEALCGGKEFFRRVDKGAIVLSHGDMTNTGR